jgi:hypothetical protein
MDDLMAPRATASKAFEALTWHSSLAPTSETPFRIEGAELVPGPPPVVRAQVAGAELGYRVGIARHGDYRMRARLELPQAGDAAPFVLEWTRRGETVPAYSQQFVLAAAIDTGAISLSPGSYTLSVGLPRQASLRALEIVPPALNAIEPSGGWRATAITTTGDVAVTALKALDEEHELPPAATPIEVPTSAFQTVTTEVLKARLSPGREGFWLEADASGLQAVAYFEIGEAGLYTVSAYGVAGSGHTWLADGTFKSLVCPAKNPPESPRWIPVMTAEFSAGRHGIGMTLADGAAIQRLRIERKKGSEPDYLGTLARLGLDLGEQRPISRAAATDAMEFIRKRRGTLDRCSDVPLASAALAQAAAPAGVRVGSNSPAGALPPGLALPGTTPSASPSGQPSPPISSPPVSPAPSPSPSPSPSLGPPPTTIAQPPASPVKDDGV